MNNQQMMRRPMQGMADQMATHGRYGDSMLVHMNPVEVQGLASLSPTGELTRNPMTGQPEAFLPFLAPLLGSLAGSSLAGGALATSLGLGSLGATAMGAIGSGLATTAVTGDIKEGIMSGLTGFGLGKAFQGASELMNPEVAKAATDVAGATDAATEAAKLANLGDASANARFDMLTGDALSVDPLTGGAPNMSPLANPITPNMSPNPISGGAVSGSQGSIAYKQNVLDGLRAEAGQNIGQNMMNNPMEFAKNFGSQAIKSGTMIPVAVGEGARAQKMAEDDMKRLNAQFEKDRQAELDRATAVRDSAIDLARNDYAYQDYGYSAGGVASINPQDYMRQMNGLQTVGMSGGGPLGMNMNFSGLGSFFNANPASSGLKQRAVRPANVVTSEKLESEAAELAAQGKDPRAGFRSEINYFRTTPEDAGIEDPNREGPGDSYDPDTTPDTEVGVPDFNIGSKGGTGSTGGLTQDQIDSINNSIENLNLPLPPNSTNNNNESVADNNNNLTIPPIQTPVEEPSNNNSRGRRGGRRPAVMPTDDAKKAVDLIGAGSDTIVPIYNPPKSTSENVDTLIGNLTGIGDGRATPLNPRENPKFVPSPMPMPMPMPSPSPSPMPMPMPMPSPKVGPMPMPAPMPMPTPVTEPSPVPMPMPMPAPMPRPVVRPKMTRGRKMAGGGIVNMQEGGIAELDPLNQSIPMQGDLGMSSAPAPMPMDDGEMQSVIAQVKQAMAQGVTPDQLPPELAQKLIQAINTFGMETVTSMLQGQPNIPESNFKPPSQRDITYSFAEGGSTDVQLIEQTIMAVLGQLSEQEADIVINQFISEFGQEAYTMLRQQALESVVPNAQTEGVIKGEGKGMDDNINGMIGDSQPVAVSPGEYIIPADVVSGLGDGSTNGGVRELDNMLDRVRQTRTGTMQQPAPMNTGGVLPA